MSLRAKKLALSRDTSGTLDQLLHPCTGYDQEGRASLRVDGLLVENGNQAEESSADHCPLERGKEGIP